MIRVNASPAQPLSNPNGIFNKPVVVSILAIVITSKGEGVFSVSLACRTLSCSPDTYVSSKGSTLWLFFAKDILNCT